MSRFDESMKEALGRREPPAGFTEKVLARAAEQSRRRSRWQALLAMFQGPRMRWAVAVAAVALMVAGAQLYSERQERLRGEHAKQQVLLALKITANQLQSTRQKVLEITAMETQ
ncbi:MAG: hypothetical protein GY953_09595 [bacterium]|nr:hypothetical protein [bacterium]